MRKLINRIREPRWLNGLRAVYEQLVRLTKRVNDLEHQLAYNQQRVEVLEQQRRLATAKAKLITQEHLEKADIANSDPTVTRLRPH